MYMYGSRQEVLTIANDYSLILDLNSDLTAVDSDLDLILIIMDSDSDLSGQVWVSAGVICRCDR